MLIGPLATDVRDAAARLLFEEFREYWPEAWATIDAALAEVDEALDPEKIAFGAFDDRDRLVGWIGAQPMYGGHVWELHPPVVTSSEQRRGIGSALVGHLADHVRMRGAITLWVGTDDEAGLTSLGGVDLYPGILEKALRLESTRDHPVTFYRKLGFEVAGVVPDANGFGRPDILMAKRIG